jgi:hypothetical protein
MCEGGFKLGSPPGLVCVQSNTTGINGALFVYNDLKFISGTTVILGLNTYTNNFNNRTFTGTTTIKDSTLKSLSYTAVSTSVGTSLSCKPIITLAYWMQKRVVPTSGTDKHWKTLLFDYADVFAVLCSAGGDFNRFKSAGVYNNIVMVELLQLLAYLRGWAATSVVTDVTFIQLLMGVDSL